MATAKPYATLPEPAQRDTKRKRATMQLFNSKIDALLKERGAVVVRDWPAGDDSIGEYDMRYWQIETPAGPLQILPAGDSVMCRFLEPADRAMPREQIAKVPQSWLLNTYSGKWNHHYFGARMEDAIACFTASLDQLLKRGETMDRAGKCTPS